MPIVSKNGQDFFEIADEPDEMDKAYAKGYRPYMDMTKDGKEIFTILAEPNQIQKAMDKGYLEVSAFERGQNAMASDRKKEAPKWASAAQGAASSMAWGFDDEIAGGASALGALATGDDPAKAYSDTSERIRAQKDRLQSDNPGSYLLGSIGGGVATPALFARGASTLAGQIGRGAAAGGAGGAIQGAGDAESMDRVVSEAIEGGLKGAAFGSIFGALARPKSLKQEGFDEVGKSFKTIAGGYKEGAAQTEAYDLLGRIGKTGRGLKGMFKAIRDQANKDNEFAAMIKKAKQDIKMGGSGGGGGPRGPSFSDELPDEEFVMRMLLDDGPNPVKKWVAEKAASLYPGQVDAELYQNLLAKPMDERILQRAFNRKDVGRELKPDFEQTRDLFKRAVGERFGELQGEARSQFARSNDADRILRGVAKARERIFNESENVPSALKSIEPDLRDVQLILTKGIDAAKDAPIGRGNWNEVADDVRFDRLQAARQYIDKQIDFKAIKTGRKNPNASESNLLRLRDEINRVLKFSPEKVEADSLYSQAKKLEDKFWKIAEFKGDVDEFEIAKLMNDTDKAGRFRNYIDEVQEFANRKDLPEELRDNANELVGRLRKAIEDAEGKRALDQFRFKQGPTSPAIERQTAVLNKSRPAQEAIQAPASFINAADQFIPAQAEQRFGKTWHELNDPEKTALIRFWTWRKSKGENASAADENKVWDRIASQLGL